MSIKTDGDNNAGCTQGIDCSARTTFRSVQTCITAFCQRLRAAVFRRWPSPATIRFEQFNTASAFEGLSPSSLTPTPLTGDKVWTAGFNFNLNAHVVLKADVRRFQEDATQNRVNLGLGWAF